MFYNSDMDSRKRVPIGGLREYIQKCEDWLRVSHGARTRRKFQRGKPKGERWHYPDVERRSRLADQQATREAFEADIAWSGPDPDSRDARSAFRSARRPEGPGRPRSRRAWPGSTPPIPDSQLVRVDRGLMGCASQEVRGDYRYDLVVHWPDGRVEPLRSVRQMGTYAATRGGLV